MTFQLAANTVTVGVSEENNIVYTIAETIWGIKADKLPKEKYDEIHDIKVRSLEKKYGPYNVKGFGHTMVVLMDPIVLEAGYKKSPCSLGSCMVTDAAFRCSNCKTAMYCGRDHQVCDWSRHKVECKKKH